MDGRDALHKVMRNVQENEGRKCDYVLILMDCNMPVMDGYEATSRIRQFLFDNALPQPLVSAVTGHSEQSYVDRAFEAGMNLVLSKPVSHEHLDFLLSKLEFPRLLQQQ
uniref:Response regulatory domain-containing protein n=1 Tax=Strombidium rassoulzadegani TaxID=1082188 RepID=A0A7S3FUJ6_9SPIT|mmetsp:Transcript_13418/g.22852  ORF Transcript_13418/g.22852 Transcript_13418/m.22852 type:complete len:109 (+) Transcript_13418:157-483(+)